MNDEQLERVIVDFIEGKFDVLVCTTIIESGIDMPNVNTIIIDQAHLFGLAQLYQLRGRVGRSNVQAYAYLICPSDLALTGDAVARIESILSNQELGSGFQVANRDLEIRGAGNLLGAEQSGKIAGVGLQTYTRMLEQAVAEILGKWPEPQPIHDPEIQIDAEAIIPASFVASEADRLMFYRKFFQAGTVGEILGIMSDLRDRFGELPIPVINLGRVARLKLALKDLRAKSCRQASDCTYHIHFGQLTPERIRCIQERVEKHPRHLSLGAEFQLICRPEGDDSGTCLETLNYILAME
jgi:transcription-repair coupling factor (superfamily II helicase)